MSPHRVVDQHTLKRLDIFLERFAFGCHDRLHFFVIRHQKRGNCPRPAPRLQHRAFGEVDQLAHVSGPWRLQQLRRFLRAHLWRVAAIFLGKLVRQRREQGQNILTPVAQWWRRDFECCEPIVKVGSQRVFAGPPLILQVTNGDDPRLGWRALIIDHRQQTRLCGI